MLGRLNVRALRRVAETRYPLWKKQRADEKRRAEQFYWNEIWLELSKSALRQRDFCWHLLYRPRSFSL